MALQVVCAPALTDNYIWVLHDAASNETVAVDPSERGPVCDVTAPRGWRAQQVWNTHWHPDHTGGNAMLSDFESATITGPAAEAARIPEIDFQVRDGDKVRIGAIEGVVIETPGHTAGHVAFYLPSEGIVFTGDTLFACGCGRLLEGTPAQMHASLQRLAELPDDTVVYCGHEYTLSNARFAVSIDPGNAAVADRLHAAEALRARGKPTVPTTIGAERATNPFMRASDVNEFAHLRAAKDRFAG